MRIAMVNHAFRPLPPEPADSPAVVIDRLATALIDRGHEVIAIGGRGGARPSNYEVVRLERPKVAASDILAELTFASRVGTAIAAVRPDIVHHHASTPAAFSRSGRAPVVLSYASPIAGSQRSPTMGTLSVLSTFVERVACSRATRIVAVSQTSAEFLQARYGIPSDRIDVITNGVDTEMFKPLTLHPADGRILCVARISPYKDQETLIRALATAPLRDTKATVVLAGPVTDPAYGQRLKHLSEALGVGTRVEWRGAVPFSELPRMYSDAAVVAAPSRAEGMPLALLEAMSMGRPVVASAIAQHLAVGDDAGVTFVPEGDPAALAVALERTLRDPLHRLPQAAPRRRVQERFSWRAIASGYERAYLSAIGS